MNLSHMEHLRYVSTSTHWSTLKRRVVTFFQRRQEPTDASKMEGNELSISGVLYDDVCMTSVQRFKEINDVFSFVDSGMQ